MNRIILSVGVSVTSLMILVSYVSNQASATEVIAGGFGSGDCTYGPCRPRLQQLYDNNLFGLNPITIDSVANYANGGIYVGNYDVFLSTSPSSVGAISSTFADNRGSDFQFFGSIALAGSSLSLMDLVTATGSFPYDPSAGDLLVEWVQTSPTSTWGGFQATPGTGDLSRLHFTNLVSTTGFVDQDYGIATRFTFEVPEPTTLSLATVSILVACCRRRKRD